MSVRQRLKHRLESLLQAQAQAVQSMQASKGGFSPKDSIDRAVKIACLNARVDEVRDIYSRELERTALKLESLRKLASFGKKQ